MKKSLCAMLVSLLSFSYAGDVTPTISLRVDDMLGGLEFAAPIIGLKMGLSDGVSTGLDANALSTRIYIERSYGKVGLGTTRDTDGDGDVDIDDDGGLPFFTIGTSYNAYGNLNIEVEYVVNRLTENDDALQLSLTIGF